MNPAYPFDLARGKKSGLSFGRATPNGWNES